MSVFDCGNLGEFFDRWRCSQKERELLLIELQVIRFRQLMRDLDEDRQTFVDGDGI